MENIFNKWWLSLEGMINIISYEKDFINFLLDIQSDYRIQRALWEDEWDRLLNWTRIIDDIISRIPQLNQARLDYLEKKRLEEEEKLKEQMTKK